MAFVETLSDFFSTDTPGHATVVIGGATVVGLKDNPYQTGLEIGGSVPVVHVVAADVGSVAYGASLTVDGTSYTVSAVEPDGHGVLMLRLQEV